MKLITFLIFLFFYGSLSAQEIPKKANVIIITDTLSQEQSYNKITEILFEYGYGIQNFDRPVGTITTTLKPIKGATVKLNFLIKDNKVSVRGDFLGPSVELYDVINNRSSVIENRGMNGSPAKNAWDELCKITDQVPGKKEYLIK